MKGLIAAIMILAVTGAALADTRRDLADEWNIYRQFLTQPACGTSDAGACEKVLESWRRDFAWATDPSWKAQLTGQRNLAFCLLSGCSGDVKVNVSLACAWAKVVLLSGDPLINDEDIGFERKACSALATEMQRKTAEAQADRLLRMLRVR